MPFRALVARSQSEVAFEDITPPPNDVLINVAYSSLNYKDGLAVTGRGKIVRRFPMVVGIDLAGTVVESNTEEFKPGDRVVGHGQGLGETDWGGYAQRESVRADAIVRIPGNLTLEESMRIGTAGFTAMLCVLALEQNDVRPSEREVIVTGACGGVGSLAVHLLAQRGYKVAASTGRAELESYLRGLGATSIVPREELTAKPGPLQSERWAGGVDTVGGDTLANIFAQTAYEGAIACCGMAGSHELNTTVWPLILRNVSLLGVSSIKTSKAKRIAAWNRLASDVDRSKLAEMSRTEALSDIFGLANEILDGRVRGRVVIDVAK
jgi:putative YhdH/YhfP family quinone oxidoreductase